MQDFDPDKKYFGFDISFVKKKCIYIKYNKLLHQ